MELRIEKPLTQEVKQVFAGKNEIQKPLYGAVERTRTSTLLRVLAPQASASTNSATTARGVLFSDRQEKKGEGPKCSKNTTQGKCQEAQRIALSGQ